MNAAEVIFLYALGIIWLTNRLLDIVPLDSFFNLLFSKAPSIMPLSPI